MMRMEGKVALVTGAARGLGESIVRDFVAEGARVIATDLNEQGGLQLASALPDNVLFLKHDVRSRDSWNEVIAAGIDRYGDIAVLVNNAVRHDMAPFEQMDEDEFRAVFEVNELGCFLGMQTVMPTMRRAGRGSIVNISSIAGMHPSGGIAYCASKWAIRGMTKTVAHDLAPEGIRVNSVHPGWMRTPSTQDGPTELAERILPMRRIGEPEEVARLVTFLASDDASFATGRVYLIDGGALMLGTLEVIDGAGDGVRNRN